MQSNDSPVPVRWVQSCITNVSFPKTLEELDKMLGKNSNLGEGATDLDTLLAFTPGQVLEWTAPRWMTTGDILFFYHAVSAKPRIVRLLKQARQTSPLRDDLIQVLERVAVLAERYGGTIFACTEIIDTPAYDPDEHNEYHFDSRVFAPFDQLHLFPQPLPASVFSAMVKISGQSALTPLAGREFEGVKKLLGEQNELPDFLRNASPGSTSFRNVDKTNWRSISCAADSRFIGEVQVRAYLLDYLLDEIRDERTSIHQECRCMRGGQKTGFADYFMKFHGQWIPVEAKLNILAEPNILLQVAKYTHIDRFIPTKGAYREKSFETPDSPHCLIVDQAGVYLVSNGTFINCASARPFLTREEIGRLDAASLRQRLGAFLK
jgi:hypothetical protein